MFHEEKKRSLSATQLEEIFLLFKGGGTVIYLYLVFDHGNCNGVLSFQSEPIFEGFQAL